MPTVPEQLQQARLMRRLTIQQVADITKIRTDYIRALEEGRYEVFSAPVYVRGFVRSYASLLKLNVPQLMAELDKELKQCPKFHEPEPEPTRRFSFLTSIVLWTTKLRLARRSVLLIGLVILAGVVAFAFMLRQYRAKDKITDIKPGLYKPANPQTDTLPLPTSVPRR